MFCWTPACPCLRRVILIVPARSEAKATALVADLKKATKNDNIFAPILDLNSLASISAFTAAFVKEHKKLDVLINNGKAQLCVRSHGSSRTRCLLACPAAHVPKTKELTADGIEAQFGVNVVSCAFRLWLVYRWLSHCAQRSWRGARLQMWL